MRDDHTTHYKGYSITIENDESAIDEREEHDGHIGVMVCTHRAYTLGDIQVSSGADMNNHFAALCNADESQYLDCAQLPNRETLGELQKRGTLICLPLYLLDHSGITISTGEFSCRWDSGQVGFIYATANSAIECYGEDWADKITIEDIKAQLIAEVARYDLYIRGEVYGAIVTSPPNVYGEDESCWNLYGMEEALEWASQCVDSDIGYRNRTRLELAKTLIVHKVPLGIRQSRLASI